MVDKNVGFIDRLKERFRVKSVNKQYEAERTSIIKSGVHSELVVDRPDGLDSGRLIFASYDTSQLEQLQAELIQRGIKTDLKKNYKGKRELLKFNLTPECDKELVLENDFENKMAFLDKMIHQGRPVQNIDFFNSEEKAIIRKWYNNRIK